MSEGGTYRDRERERERKRMGKRERERERDCLIFIMYIEKQ